MAIMDIIKKVISPSSKDDDTPKDKSSALDKELSYYQNREEKEVKKAIVQEYRDAETRKVFSDEVGILRNERNYQFKMDKPKMLSRGSLSDKDSLSRNGGIKYFR